MKKRQFKTRKKNIKTLCLDLGERLRCRRLRGNSRLLILLHTNIGKEKKKAKTEKARPASAELSKKKRQPKHRISIFTRNHSQRRGRKKNQSKNYLEANPMQVVCAAPSPMRNRIFDFLLFFFRRRIFGRRSIRRGGSTKRGSSRPCLRTVIVTTFNKICTTKI